MQGPSQSNVNRNEFNEFWKFRDKILEQIKDLERKLNKLARSIDLT